MLGIPVDDTIILKEPFRLLEAFLIMCGFYMLNYLTDAIYYEVKYWMGDEFFIGGKRYVLRLRIMRTKYKEAKYYHELKKYFHSNND